MLARTFKTAEELDLTEKGYEGLIRTLEMLETGRLVYNESVIPTTKNGFNMACIMEKHTCNSVGCIYGWAKSLAGLKWWERLTNNSDDFPDGGSAFMRLTHPYGIRHWEKITAEEAAHALRSYLSTGEADWGATWDEALAESTGN